MHIERCLTGLIQHLAKHLFQAEQFVVARLGLSLQALQHILLGTPKLLDQGRTAQSPAL